MEALDLALIEDFLSLKEGKKHVIAVGIHKPYLLAYDKETKEAHYYYRSLKSPEVSYCYNYLYECTKDYQQWAKETLKLTAYVNDHELVGNRILEILKRVL